METIEELKECNKNLEENVKKVQRKYDLLTKEYNDIKKLIVDYWKEKLTELYNKHIEDTNRLSEINCELRLNIKRLENEIEMREKGCKEDCKFREEVKH